MTFTRRTSAQAVPICKRVLTAPPTLYLRSRCGLNMVRLQKAIYGLKQAGRKWYDALLRILTDIGFSVSGADPGVFVAHEGGHILILAVHVDNCIITESSLESIKDFKMKLNDRYALTDLGPIQ